MNQQQPGYNAHYGNATTPTYPQQPQQAQRRLDPDQLPSPVRIFLLHIRFQAKKKF